MTDATKNAAPLMLKMKGVELMKSQINPQPATFAVKEFQFTVNVENRLEPSQKIAIIVTSVDVKSDKNPEIHASLSSACIYGVDNFDEIFKKLDNDKYDTPDQVMFTLVSISLSTLRGILYEQFRGTYLHQAYLPIMDPKLFKANPQL